MNYEHEAKSIPGKSSGDLGVDEYVLSFTFSEVPVFNPAMSTASFFLSAKGPFIALQLVQWRLYSNPWAFLQ